MPVLPTGSDILKGHQRFLIICHEEPDGDALGSSLALRAALISSGKQATVVCKDSPAPPFQFLPDVAEIKHGFRTSDFEALIIIDCGDLERTGFADRIIEFCHSRKPILNIDHHPKNNLHKVASVNLVDVDAAASAQIVYALMRSLNIPVTPSMATMLLTGLYTDTGGFKHSNTTPAVLELASKLLLAGGRLKIIVRNITTTRPLAALRLWGTALARIRKHPVLPLVSSIVTQQDLVSCKASVNDLGGVVNLINGIPGAQAAILFTELPGGEVKISIRTETEGVDVSKIAAFFGGGGHKKAAGFRFWGDVRKEGSRWLIEPKLTNSQKFAGVSERYTHET